jgi:diguanylate cyclase (GGDEF)-like protein
MDQNGSSNGGNRHSRDEMPTSGVLLRPGTTVEDLGFDNEQIDSSTTGRHTRMNLITLRDLYNAAIEQVEKLGAELARIKAEKATLAREVKHWFRECQSAKAELESWQRDPLTGLYQRRLFLDKVENEIKRARRFNFRKEGDDFHLITPLTFMMLDLDHFKQVNDNHGHHVGDMVLKSFASCMISSIRDFDIAARWGGEEFIIVLPGCPMDVAIEVARSIRRKIISDKLYFGTSKRFAVTATVGVTQMFTPFETFEDISHRVDQLLYRGKGEGGRNCIVVDRENGPEVIKGEAAS